MRLLAWWRGYPGWSSPSRPWCISLWLYFLVCSCAQMTDTCFFSVTLTSWWLGDQACEHLDWTFLTFFTLFSSLLFPLYFLLIGFSSFILFPLPFSSILSPLYYFFFTSSSLLCPLCFVLFALSSLLCPLGFVLLAFSSLLCAHLTLPYMTASTRLMFSYYSAIECFAPRASRGTILESKLMLSQRYEVMRYEDTQIAHECFEGSSAHWTLSYMTTSSLHLFRYNSVIEWFSLKEPREGPYWRANLSSLKSTKIQGFEDTKIRISNINVSRDQVHIGHCHTWQLLLFICSATIVSFDGFAPRASSGTVMEESKRMLSQRYEDTRFWRYEDTQIKH